jgi:predicted nucleotidyltransferase
MNSDSLKQLFLDSHNYQVLKDDPATQCIFVAGSITRNQFIEGFSDIDLLTVFKDMNIAQIEKVAAWKKELEQLTKLKTGIGVVSDADLRFSVGNLSKATSLAKYATQVHESNPTLVNGVLYKASSYEIPILTSEQAKTLLLDDYLLSQLHGLRVYAQANTFEDDPKAYIRKIMKIGLISLQVIHMHETGEYISDFSTVLTTAKLNTQLSLESLEKIYNRRQDWRTINESELDSTLRDEMWQLTNAICYEKLNGNV